MNHSELPWNAYAELNIENSKGEFVASCGVNGRTDKSKANVNFIVRCVNNHEKLLEASRAAFKELLQHGVYDGKTIKLLMQAIQSAEELK